MNTLEKNKERLESHNEGALKNMKAGDIISLGWEEYTCISCEKDQDNSCNIIIETKATTTNKFKSLKYKENGVDEGIFLKKNNVFYLKEEILEQNYPDKYFKQRDRII